MTWIGYFDLDPDEAADVRARACRRTRAHAREARSNLPLRAHQMESTGFIWDQAKRNALAHLTPEQRHAIARAQAEKTLARLKAWDEADHPRGEGGKFTESGGGGGGSKDKLEGYSDKAKLINGVIHTSDVYDAVKALHEDRRVELKQPKQISTLIKELGKISREMVEQGEAAPNFDLCKVTVKGTNLFCADTKGIPRIKMPQMDDVQTKAFVKQLESEGYATEKGREQSANLRATQNQLIGAKVAKFYKRIRKDPEGRGDDKRLVVSRDDYVLDGHHHWAAQVAADAEDNKLGNHKTRITRIDIGIIELLDKALKFTGGKGAKEAAWAAVRAESEAILARLKEWNEAEHPRVPAGSPDGGQFGAGGGGASGGDRQPVSDDKLEPHVVNVGGDKWNQDTARRLEREYQAVKPNMTRLEQKAIGATEEARSGDDDEDEAPFVPDEWDVLPTDLQDKAEEEFNDKNFYEFHNSEVENWGQETGPHDALMQVAEQFNSGDKTEWAKEALDELRDERDEAGETPYPFTNEQLLAAIEIDYPDHGYPKPKYTKIEFDDDKLTDPEGFDPAQQTLPSMDPLEAWEKLTPEMRKEISEKLIKEFSDEGDRVFSDLEPPEYLADSAKEQMDEYWDQMGATEKWEFVANKTDLLDDYKDETGALTTELKLDKLPERYDPLNKTTGQDYKRTQTLARYLSRERAKEIMEERGIDVPSDRELNRVDAEMWRDWKSSSTSSNGCLIQVAAADELGGRLNAKTRDAIDAGGLRAGADVKFESVGGYAGIKAMMRAKWETTQHLLDKADEDNLDIYRGMTMEKDVIDKMFGVTKHFSHWRDVKGHTHLPTMDVMRNGAASTTTDMMVANNWKQGQIGKVTLRAVVPRTAALSIPAYGINIQSEHEVVVVGTAWHGWDVFKDKAPSLDAVPLITPKIAA